MNHRSKFYCLLIVSLLILLIAGCSNAQTVKPADAKELTERVQTLEKENLVLREDLGKTRLDARSALEAASKRQQEAVAKAMKDMKEQMEKERAAQAKRNRNFWIAIGVVAIAAVASK